MPPEDNPADDIQLDRDTYIDTLIEENDRLNKEIHKLNKIILNIRQSCHINLYRDNSYGADVWYVIMNGTQPEVRRCLHCNRNWNPALGKHLCQMNQ